jgi:hypothetical protein
VGAEAHDDAVNRLQLELDRLYGLGAGAADAARPDNARDVRALVLELALPAGWTELLPVWMGVQTDLELPAPAIAVSGFDSLQLWFALAAPIPQAAGARFLEGLRQRYLPQLKPTQVRLVTAAGRTVPAPPVERSPGRWSAFVSADLASVFSDTPWLDVPPGEEGQAALLRPLAPIARPAFEAASERLAASGPEAAREAPPAPPPQASPAADDVQADPARFLARVMADEAAPLALRIEAAKALLPWSRRT